LLNVFDQLELSYTSVFIKRPNAVSDFRASALTSTFAFLLWSSLSLPLKIPDGYVLAFQMRNNNVVPTNACKDSIISKPFSCNCYVTQFS